MLGRKNNSTTEIEFVVPGMMCDGCADTIRAALTVLKGVEQVKPNAWRKRVRVRYESAEIDIAALQAAFASVGYEATEAQ